MNARRRRGRPDGWLVAAGIVAALAALPVAVVFGHVFVPTGDFWTHLATTLLPDYLANTLWIMVGVAAGVTIGGVGCAWLVSLCRFPGRRVLEWALLLPFAVPAYVIAYTYTGLLDYSGPVQGLLRDAFGWQRGDYWFPEIRSLGGAIAMMVLVLYPYVYMLSRAAFLEQSVCSLEASRTLGCGPWGSMVRVALPLARPSIVAGVALALMEALNDFGTVQYFGVSTFVTGIYRTWLGQGNPTGAAQLAVLLLVFVFALLWLERRSRGQASYHHMSTRYRPLPAYRLTGWRAAGAIVFCSLPVLFGFALPAVALVVWTLRTASTVIDAKFVTLMLNTVTLGVSAAAIAVVVALVLGYGLRRRPGIGMTVLTRVAALGYAVPGAVIAIGVVLPFAWVDNRVDGFLRSTFGVSSGLLLSGTLFTLLFAYVVRFLAISFGAVDAGLSRVTRHMDEAARTLGHRTGGILWRVHAPMLKGSMLTAALLVFVDVMKELPATLMIRPFNFDTLAIRTYEYAVDEQLMEAAPSALAIVLVGIAPVILLNRAIARARPGQATAAADEAPLAGLPA
jgi:iron(III) transport system permease protein